VRRAIQLALQGQVDAVVTAPIHKVSWDLAGIGYPGHTELLAEVCRVEEYMMAFFIPRCWIGLVTTHLPLSKVPRAIRARAILSKLRLLDRWLRDLGHRGSSIGACALNPHSGESGLLGREDKEEILPAVRQAQKEGISVEGPFPADALFSRPKGFQAILAMYHDQALIAAKVLGRGRAVHVTLGLPFVRTSPAHGTAFDIAGQGRADPEGLIAALRLASRLTRQRARHLGRRKAPSPPP
jgi:4-hydroxythreonine-4-phosphate dehydrogenase